MAERVDTPELKGVAFRDNALLHMFEVIRLERENKIINKMISDVRKGKSTYESLYGGIAAIAELRSTTKDIEQSLTESTMIEAIQAQR